MANQTPDAKTQLDIYSKIVLIKTNDEQAMKAVRTGRLLMPYYSPRGQECIPSAVSVNLHDTDYICTIYRGIHDMLAKGMPLKLLWAELAGRATGTCKGKGGPMHITHPQSGIMITTGIVGSSMPVANGLAWGSQLKKDGRVTVAYFGDGASNIGAFHESLNLAAVWKLPVVFVCQNNQYAEHTTYEKCTSAEHVADRAVSYRMPGVTVDGNDPFAVYDASKTAIERARSGQGPTLLEAVTFRFNGHNMGDNDAYMPAERKKAAMADDPVPRYRAKLLATGVATEEQLVAIEKHWFTEIEAAIQYALDSPFPEIIELKRDVYAEELA